MDRKSMVFIAMGVECVGVVLACMWLGGQLGEKYGWGVLGPAVGAFLGLIGWVVHLLAVARSLEKSQDSSHTPD